MYRKNYSEPTESNSFFKRNKETFDGLSIGIILFTILIIILCAISYIIVLFPYIILPTIGTVSILLVIASIIYNIIRFKGKGGIRAFLDIIGK